MIGIEYNKLRMKNNIEIFLRNVKNKYIPGL
jgi:hypothetical protein